MSLCTAETDETAPSKETGGNPVEVTASGATDVGWLSATAAVSITGAAAGTFCEATVVERWGATSDASAPHADAPSESALPSCWAR